ncbi:hypothetical protein DRO54_04000 [Candidatus Bathyarchaeota archaeon]|nr:MAG: hypothetical protein DRO54_04000 [Candidatus Bathyarchaeota archaeon]
MIGNNDEEEKRKTKGEEAEEVKEILSVVSKEIPALIKGIIASVFSEEAGRNMGKAAAAFYKELKESGMPDEVAIKMTENYISVFTSLGDLMKKFTSGKEKSTKLEKEIEKKIREKLAEKGLLEEEEEE